MAGDVISSEDGGEILEHNCSSAEVGAAILLRRRLRKNIIGKGGIIIINLHRPGLTTQRARDVVPIRIRQNILVILVVIVV